MKIKVVDKKENRRLTLYLSTSIVKLKLTWKIISKKSKEAYKYYPLVKECYGILKRYIKENGHFIFVEVSSNSGDRVIIKV